MQINRLPKSKSCQESSIVEGIIQLHIDEALGQPPHSHPGCATRCYACGSGKISSNASVSTCASVEGSGSKQPWASLSRYNHISQREDCNAHATKPLPQGACGGLPTTIPADILDTGAMPWPSAAARRNAGTAASAIEAIWAAFTILKHENCDAFPAQAVNL